MQTIHKCNKECPFGHPCERCNLYRPIYKTDGKTVTEQIYDCQINHLAQLQSDLLKAMTGVQAAVESRGNDMVKEQKLFRLIAENAQHHSKRISDVQPVQALHVSPEGDECDSPPGERITKGTSGNGGAR